MYPQFLATKRYEMLEIQIPADSTGSRFNIPDQPQLRTDQNADIVIQAMEVYTVNSVPLSPNNIAVVTMADLKKTYLTLYIDGEESMYRIPLVTLARIRDTATTDFYSNELFKMRNLMVDWTKSYFFTPAAYSAGSNDTFSFLLGVHYYKLPPGTMAGINDQELAGFKQLAAGM